jgi:hypothetical protein
MIEYMNLIIINNINNKIFDFDSLETSKSILVKKCNDICINITNKINKIIIEKSNNITINVNKLISGIEITCSNNVIINGSIPFIECYKSNVFLYGSIDIYRDVIVSSDMSLLCNINS